MALTIKMIVQKKYWQHDQQLGFTSKNPKWSSEVMQWHLREGKTEGGNRNSLARCSICFDQIVSPSHYHVCDWGFIAGSCTTFQHMSKPISFSLHSDEYHFQLQRGLLLALKWESKPWSLLKSLIEKTVSEKIQFNVTVQKKYGNL